MNDELATVTRLEFDLEVREHVLRERWLALALAAVTAVAVALAVS